MRIDDIITSPSQIIDLVYDGRTILGKSELYDQLKYLWGDREFYVRGSNPSAEFKSMISAWWARRGYHFARLFDAFEIDYNPIENTDRYETITDTTTGNGTMESGSHSTANGAVNDEVVQKSNSYNVSDSVVGKTSNTNNTTSDASTTSSNVSSSNQVFEHDAHIHGNIGTMTAAQLLQGEKTVRFMDLTYEIIKEFIDLYTSY